VYVEAVVLLWSEVVVLFRSTSSTPRLVSKESKTALRDGSDIAPIAVDSSIAKSTVSVF
jgi:hypothetical protein